MGGEDKQQQQQQQQNGSGDGSRRSRRRTQRRRGNGDGGGASNTAGLRRSYSTRIPADPSDVEDFESTPQLERIPEDDDRTSRSRRQQQLQQQQPALPDVRLRQTRRHTRIHDDIIKLPKEVRNLLAGGMAGMVAKTVVAPVDRIKILYQVTSAEFRLTQLPHVAYNIIRNEGTTALWKGNLATMIRVFPYSGIQFMIFDRCKTYFLHEHDRLHRPSSSSSSSSAATTTSRHDRKFGLSPLESLVSGMTAGMISVVCTYPLDLTRAQLAVLRKHTSCDKTPTRGFVTVLTDNYRQRGVRKGLFRGISPTICGILPYSGIAFLLNEQGKREIQHMTGRDLTTTERMQCGAFAGLIAQSITYPIEVTRRRMQTLGVVPSNDTAINNALDSTIQRRGRDTYLSPSSPSAASSSGTASTSTGQGHVQPKVAPQQPSQLAPPTVSSTVRTLYAEQGVRGFFKGVSMNWMKGPIAFSISFTTFDTIQSMLETEDERERRLPTQQQRPPMVPPPSNTAATSATSSSSSSS